MKRTEVVRKVAEHLHKIAPDAQCILYGSEARGDARADSDIDILVKLPYHTPEKEFQKRRMAIIDSLYDIELDSGIIISAHVVPKGMWEKRRTFFSINVEREGIII